MLNIYLFRQLKYKITDKAVNGLLLASFQCCTVVRVLQSLVGRFHSCDGSDSYISGFISVLNNTYVSAFSHSSSLLSDPSRFFFQNIYQPTSCLYPLLPSVQDMSVTSRLTASTLLPVVHAPKILLIYKLWPRPLPVPSLQQSLTLVHCQHTYLQHLLLFILLLSIFIVLSQRSHHVAIQLSSHKSASKLYLVYTGNASHLATARTCDYLHC